MAPKALLTFLCSFALANAQFNSFNYFMTGSRGPQVNEYDYISYQPVVNRQTFNQQPFNQQSFNQQPQGNFQSSSASCNSYFSYQSDYNGNYGLVSIPIPSGISEIRMKVKMTLAARLSTNYVGTVDLAKDKANSAYDVANGQPLQYRISFPLQNPLPKPVEIYLNDQLLCTGAKDVASYVTNIMLDHTFITGASGLSTGNFAPRPPANVPNQRPVPQEPVYRPEPAPTRSPDMYTRPAPVPQTTQYQPQPIQASNVADQCGNPDYVAPTTTALVIGGRTTVRGQFPWMAAYYHNGRGDSRFICGGSLVSTKLVVTAAHCIQNKRDSSAKKPEEASFYMGKHNLESLSGEPNYVVSGVTQFIVHQDWNVYDDRYDADIAIAVLLRTVSFTKFVKPICLWTTTTSSDDIVGKRGVVAGWGKTEFDAVSTAQPFWTDLPVVSTLTCIRTNDAFNTLTSERTFCAGDRNGKTGPCLGDSGGGFVVQDHKKWYLRGVVSASLLDATLQTCDTKNYAVFTDVVKFNSWIQGYIRSYG